MGIPFRSHQMTPDRPAKTEETDAEAKVSWTDVTVRGTAGTRLDLRIYRPATPKPGPVVVHLHSGFFVAGSLESGGAVSKVLARAGALVVAVDYPLAPQHPFPQALEAGFDVLTLINRGRIAGVNKKAPLYVAGEEAGGNLAAALALMARDQQSPVLAGQILLSPMLDPCLATCSVREAKAGAADCQWADGWQQYLGSAAKAAHPYASPIGSSRLAGLAPALLLTAEDDLLRDETLKYARRLRESGVAVRERILSAPTGWPCALHANTSDAAWSDELRECFAGFFADTPTCPSPQTFQHHVRA